VEHLPDVSGAETGTVDYSVPDESLSPSPLLYDAPPPGQEAHSLVLKVDPNTRRALQRSALLKIVGGVLGASYLSPGWAALLQNAAGGILTQISCLLFFAVYLWGFVDWAHSKGRPWYTAVLGLLTCVGVIILACLPDLREARLVVSDTNYPRHPHA
jgi:hypothetical protein